MSRTTLKRVRRGGFEPSLAQTRRAVTNGSLLFDVSPFGEAVFQTS